MNENNNLSRQPIVDKNGVISSRLKKVDPKAGVPSAALSSHAPIKGDEHTIPDNINWDTVSPDQARKLGAVALTKLDDPNRVWTNLDFYRGMLESNNGGVAIELIAEHNVPKRLSDAWMKSYEMDQDDASSFLRATSEEFDQFTAALADFNMAIRLADQYSGLGIGADTIAKSRTPGAGSNQSSSEEPAEVRGTFVSWSDVNPFKRRSKK